MEDANMLFEIVTGGHLPISNHPLFSKLMDEASIAYNNFVDEANLSDCQISALRKLIELKCAIERLGYYTAFKIGGDTSQSDIDRAHMLFEFLGMSKEDRAKVLDFMAELSGRKG